MSNEEKKRLEEYRKKRSKYVMIQMIICLSLFLVFLGLFFIYQNVAKPYYITYRETSSIEYKVELKENDIFEEEYLGEDYSYVGTMVDSIIATFSYNLEIDAEKVNYNFTTQADALVQIVDTSTKNAIYKKNYNILPSKTQKIETNKLILPLQLDIDFDSYDTEVNTVVSKLNLKNYQASLIVNVSYDIESGCYDYDSNTHTRTLTLVIPLDVEVFKITKSQPVPMNDQTIACEKSEYLLPQIVGNLLSANQIKVKSEQKATFKIISTIVFVLDIISLIVLVSYVYITKDTHIDYSNKVKKIYNSYKSFIHKINNRFDKTGYQVLYVSTIKELLQIRDTQQYSILMYENDDKTMTEFVIPTGNNLLYVYEVKIDNYDKIYGLTVEKH